ncbi:hypothetical protein B1R32_11134 [Abditibacterium utsteinense]|uniref:Uncharacterized protein n=1 Tax=Abditibacterium utsteinense TaxID=1960156 RepID=A0A2S8SRN7_9BACT|nr:permease prefix domain 1-containing protein [Abditibacterium utsteinense]PQV63473.1 hypothetical protein B1R32_11134 [Abditibacterium utsteinense]
MQNTQLENYLRNLKARLHGLTSVQRESEMREVQQHLEALVAWHIQQGKSPDDATQAAIQQFGAPTKLGSELNGIAFGKRVVSKCAWVGRAFLIWCCWAAGQFLLLSMNEKPSDSPHLLWSHWITSAMLATWVLFSNPLIDKAVKKWNSRHNVA